MCTVHVVYLKSRSTKAVRPVNKLARQYFFSNDFCMVNAQDTNLVPMTRDNYKEIRHVYTYEQVLILR